MGITQSCLSLKQNISVPINFTSTSNGVINTTLFYDSINQVGVFKYTYTYFAWVCCMGLFSIAVRKSIRNQNSVPDIGSDHMA